MFDIIIKGLIGLVLVIVFLPVINMLTSVAVTSNTSAFAFANMITLVIGLSGIFFVLMYLMHLFGSRQQQPGAGGFQ